MLSRALENIQFASLLDLLLYPLVSVQAEVHTLTHQLEEVKQELALEKKKSRLMTEAAPSAGEDRATGVEGKDQLVTMEMQVLNERQRAELANVR